MSTKSNVLSSPPVLVSGLSVLAGDHDGFVVDQWGVLHEGANAFPEAIACLERLRTMGKKVAVLTNSGRRSEANRRLMAERGLRPDLFAAVISSGEEAWRSLRARSDPWYARLGRRCLFLSHGDDRAFLAGLDLEDVARIEDADFILLTGSDAPRLTMVDYEPVLRGGVARGLPMVCANPDMVFPQAGRLVFGAGALAARYRELGGEVRLHGKPSPSVFRACVDAIEAAASDGILVIGDSLQHDIAGARAAGFPCALVAGGIHAEELGVRRGRLPAPEAVAGLCDSAGVVPDWVVPSFTW